MDENGNFEPADVQPVVDRSQGPKSPDAALLLARIIWFAMLISQGGYLLLGPILMKGSSTPAPGGEQVSSLVAGLQNQVGLIGAVMAASILGLSFFIPVLISSTLSSRTNRLQTKLLKFVVGVAMNESVALIGFTFGFIVLKNGAYGSALIYLSIAGMLARFPTAELFAEPNGARFS